MASNTRVLSLVPVLLVPVLLVTVLGVAACGGKPEPEAGGSGALPGRPAPLRVGNPIAEADEFIAARHLKPGGGAWRETLPAPIQFGFPEKQRVTWRLETTKGVMEFGLWHEVAPLHVSMIVYLTRLGFYDGLRFHRVIQGFMAQGGCPRGNGTGWPGFKLPLELKPGVGHGKMGTLSTANMGPNSDGSQFFITFRPTPELDRQYTAFGEITAGLDVLRAFEAVAAPPRARSSEPREPLLITKASVELR